MGPVSPLDSKFVPPLARIVIGGSCRIVAIRASAEDDALKRYGAFMPLTNAQLRKLAKKLMDREREAVYGDSISTDERIAMVERLIITEEKEIHGNDSQKART